MKKLPLGIQSFTKVIENGCIYVDKTKYIYELIQGNCVFFARPRRFGKSLLCSTLEALFLGKKELFIGLWIDKNTDYQWPVHPVIHIDLSQVSKANPAELTASLMRTLDGIAETYKLEKLEYTTPGEMLKKLTTRLFEKYGSKNRVVLLIDEYDKPILDTIDKPATAEEMRTILKNFYEFIKGLDDYLRFVFITGVTRFSKTSIFSGLNQLVNMSMDPRFAHLVGYTKDEIDLYFQERMQEIADGKKRSITGGIQELKQLIEAWYDGYRFWKDQPLQKTNDGENSDLARLYTPYSILSFLDTADFSNYWFESATPSFLIKVLQQHQFPLESFENLTADMNELMTFDIADLPLATLLFQSGYATIKTYDPSNQYYELEMPNYEVKDSLLKSVLSAMTAHRTSRLNSNLIALRNSLENGPLEAFIEKIKTFYSKVPYEITIDKEKYYQTIFYLLVQLINLRPEAEKATNIGRIDLVVETHQFLYIFEFKLNKSAQEALDQILQKKYYEFYSDCGKKIKLVGINFSSTEKNVVEYLAQDLE